MGPFELNSVTVNMSDKYEQQKDEDWGSGKDQGQPQGDYEGPAGMDVDGVIESTWNEVATSFDDMNLSDDLLRGIYAYGFEKPSAIQQRAILPCIAGHDAIANLQRINIKKNDTQALILAPT